MVAYLNFFFLAYLRSSQLEILGPSLSKNVMYEIEGSYTQQCCVMLDKKRRQVVEIKQKEAVGGVGFDIDVFRLIVQPEIDAALAMTLVIFLNLIFFFFF